MLGAVHLGRVFPRAGMRRIAFLGTLVVGVAVGFGAMSLSNYTDSHAPLVGHGGLGFALLVGLTLAVLVAFDLAVLVATFLTLQPARGADSRPHSLAVPTRRR